MNRGTKIITSVSGVFIIVLLLLGLTYAFFLTKVKGNSSDKSISVTTANLELTYGDGIGEVITGDKIMPGTTLNTKTFTVTNNGDYKTSYLVILENVDIRNVSDNTKTTFESNDFTYKLTCTNNCNGVENGVLPLTNGMLVSNEIEKNVTQTYTLTITYENTEKDQSNDMGKSLSAKVNIASIRDINPYLKNTNSLAYNIINNAALKTNGTELLVTPKTKPAEEISYSLYKTDEVEESPNDLSINVNTTYQGYYWTYGTGYRVDENTGLFTLTGVSTCKYNDGTCNTMLENKYIVSYDVSGNTSETNTQKGISKLPYIYKVITAPSSTSSNIELKYKVVSSIPKSSEKEISVTNDDYGISYYYRGAVEDNYVTLANMCWRVVRIAGDGSIKLILEDQDEVCSKSMKGNWDIGIGNFGYNTQTATDGTTLYKMNYLNPVTAANNSMITLFKNFQTNKLNGVLDKLKRGNWCLNDKTYSDTKGTKLLTETAKKERYNSKTQFYYDSYVRLYGKSTKEPTLKCNGTIMEKFEDNTTDMYVGTLTADEITFAGGKINTNNSNYYLINDYQKNNIGGWRSLSPHFFRIGYDSSFIVRVGGDVGGRSVSSYTSLRPAISLLPSTQISGGNGTKEKPYLIE